MVFCEGKPTQIRIKLINNQEKLIGADFEGADANMTVKDLKAMVRVIAID